MGADAMVGNLGSPLPWIYARSTSVQHMLLALYLRLPRFLTVPIYEFVRRYVRPDPRANSFNQVFRLVRDSEVTGAYAEFGVMKGSSIILAARAARRQHLPMRLFGFDSFEGLPSGEGEVFHQGEYRASLETARRFISRAGVGADLTRGLFSESLTPDAAARVGQIAIVHLDADIYESTRDVLRFIEPLLTPGAYLIFDDWNAFGGDPAHGERRAFLEWSGHGYCTEVELADSQAAVFRYQR